MSSLLKVPPQALDALARRVRIVDHRTGATTAWAPHDEQRTIWSACNQHDWVFAAKPRRVGATTAVQFDDMLWCLINDANGDRVRCGLFVDADEKSKERQAFAQSIITELPDVFAGCDVNSDRVLFPRGSVLEFHTGSGKNAGRGGGYQRLHITELPFWLNDSTLGALLPSMSMESIVIVETTIDVTGPNGIATEQLWDDPLNRFERVFFSVEEHHDYQSDPASITDSQWEFCQGEGFSSRPHAAWWLTYALPNLCHGDVQTLMCEFPQKRAHLFSKAAGRWVQTPTEVIAPVRVVEVEGHIIQIFHELKDTSGQIGIAVDVAKGGGLDASVIAAIDKRDGRLVAMLHDNTILTTTLARATREVQRIFTIPPQSVWGGLAHIEGYEPEVAYETNGVGTGPMQYAREIGVGVIDVHLSGAQGQSIMYDVLLSAKQAAEDGTLRGPAQLARECRELHRDPVTGAWKGRKDGLVAYGHAARRARLNPFVERARKRPPLSKVVDAEAMMAAHDRSNGPEW